MNGRLGVRKLLFLLAGAVFAAGPAPAGIADFDSAVAAGSALAGMYDDGGHIHPNVAGTLSMASVIDVSKL